MFERTSINLFVSDAPFVYPWKHQKTFQFSDVFRENTKGALGTSGLNMKYYPSIIIALYDALYPFNKS